MLQILLALLIAFGNVASVSAQTPNFGAGTPNSPPAVISSPANVPTLVNQAYTTQASDLNTNLSVPSGPCSATITLMSAATAGNGALQTVSKTDAATIPITGAVNNGSGLIRLTTSSNLTTLGCVTGGMYRFTGVGGVTDANGNYPITVIDATHMDLQGSTYDSNQVYTAGGSMVDARVTVTDGTTQLAWLTAKNDTAFLQSTGTGWVVTSRSIATLFQNYAAPGYGTLTLPPLSTSFHMKQFGPGGGGGSGYRGQASAIRTGGGGGSAGCMNDYDFSTMTFGGPGASVPYLIGRGGAGGIAATINGEQGWPGALPDETTLGTGLQSWPMNFSTSQNLGVMTNAFAYFWTGTNYIAAGNAGGAVLTATNYNGPWSGGTNAKSFTATQTTTSLTVTGTVTGGPLRVGDTIYNSTGANESITAQVSATSAPGGAGVYTVSVSQTASGTFNAIGLTVIPAGSFTASQTLTTLTVAAGGTGNLGIGSTINSNGATETITQLGSGNGGAGTYTVSASQTLISQTIEVTTVWWSGAWTGSQAVLVGSGGAIALSPTGVGNTWTAQTSGTGQTLNSVIWDGTHLIAVGNAGVISTSSNGSAWAQNAYSSANNITDVGYDGSTNYVAVDNAGLTITATNPTGTWIASGVISAQGFTSVTVGGGFWMITGLYGNFYYSPTSSISWTAGNQNGSSGTASSSGGVEYVNGYFFTWYFGGMAYTSSPLVPWTYATFPASNPKGVRPGIYANGFWTFNGNNNTGGMAISSFPVVAPYAVVNTNGNGGGGGSLAAGGAGPTPYTTTGGSCQVPAGAGGASATTGSSGQGIPDPTAGGGGGGGATAANAVINAGFGGNAGPTVVAPGINFPQGGNGTSNPNGISTTGSQILSGGSGGAGGGWIASTAGQTGGEGGNPSGGGGGGTGTDPGFNSGAGGRAGNGEMRLWWKFNFLLNRDIGGAANDNAPAFQDRAAA